MITSTLRAAMVAAVALCLTATFVPSATAQSDAELRRENERLRARVRDLEQELEAARAQIRQLREEQARLRRQLQEARPGDGSVQPPPPEEEVTIDESKPHASPRALLMALEKSYQELMKDMDPGAPGSRERRAYEGALRQWTAKVNREYRDQIRWHVRLQDASGFQARLQAVDPVTDVPLGDPFTVRFNRGLARRLNMLAERGTLEGVLVLRGTLEPQVRINPDRPEAGPFDKPPLIGPYVEYDYRIEPRSLKPAAEDEAEEES